MFDATIEITIDDSTKNFKKQLKLVKEPEHKTFEYINTSKMMKNNKIEFENYSQLFENNQLTWKTEDFEMSIKSVTGKENHFAKNIKMKTNLTQIKLVKHVLDKKN